MLELELAVELVLGTVAEAGVEDGEQPPEQEVTVMVEVVQVVSSWSG